MLIVYGILALFLVGGIGMAYHTITAGAVTSYRAKVAEQEKVITEQAQKARDDAAAKIVDMDAAYQQGKTEAGVVEKKVYIRAQGVVASSPALQNAACSLSPDASALYTAALKSVTGAAVPDALLVPSIVPPVAAPVAPALSALRNAASAPPTGATPHPKPRPISK